MRPSADSFEIDSTTLVDDHVGALLGEQVLPVRRGGDGTGPHLLALDAAARPVVVEVVQLLDADGLVRALRHAGGAARLTRSDLARMYHGGQDTFEADLAVFRDRSPFLRAEQTQRGVRLVLVCADVADGLTDVIDFVSAGAQVEVLRLGVTEGPGGRRYVDVSPLRRAQGRERRPVEPGPRTGSIAVQPAVPTPASPAASSPAASSSAAPGPAASTPAASTPAASGSAASTPSTPEPFAVPQPAVVPEQPARADQSPAHGHLHAADETTLLPALDADGLPVTDLPDPADATQSRHVAPTQDDTPLPELAALAAAGPGAAELVWLRVRRGQRLVATLRADGLIELPDGSVHASPDTAAAAAADLESSTDGWRVWRFGDHGPSLRESVGGWV
jgi:hypothetical protein